MIKLIISCLNVSFKKLIVWLQLHPKLIASDYITTGRPLGRTKGVHSCVTPQGALSGGCEAWLADPSSLTYFNTNGRVSGLGETSWYVFILHSQYHGYWWPGALRCQGISSNGIDLVFMEYPGLSTRRVNNANGNGDEIWTCSLQEGVFQYISILKD